MSDGKHVLVGNHEDWFTENAAVKVYPPSKVRYGSVTFTFVNEGWAQGGMNEHGLFFDGAYTPFQEVEFDSQLVPYTGYIWQAVLDKCKTVEEALALIMKFQLPELAEAHIVLADASGNAVVVGVDHGKLAIKQMSQPYLMQTNFNPWQPKLSEEQVCWRFERASADLSNNLAVTQEHMKAILGQTHQDSLTIYSNVYDLEKRTIIAYSKRHFNKPIQISLPDIFQYGECMVPLDSLESGSYIWGNCKGSTQETLTITGKVINEKTRGPVPYANIGLLNRNIGTLSDADGSFEFSIPGKYKSEPIYFSSIGYDRRQLVLTAYKRPTEGPKVVVMVPNSTLLKEVVVREKRHIHKDRLGWMEGRDGVLPLDSVQGGGAVALLIESPKAPVFVRKIQIRLMYNSKDTSVLRLHFYAYDSASGLPGKELLTREILLKETKRYGWLRFDLTAYDIVLNERQFFVGFEWIDDMKTRRKMIAGLRDWEKWKMEQYESGNANVEVIPLVNGMTQYKYHGNMMHWPGFKQLPPFTGLMVETGKNAKTESMRTFERKTSFGQWQELKSTLCTVLSVAY